MVGVVLFLNGLNNRFGTNVKSPTSTQKESTPSVSASSIDDSAVLYSRPFVVADTQHTSNNGKADSIKSYRESNIEPPPTSSIRPEQHQEKTLSVDRPDKSAFQRAVHSFTNDPNERKKNLIIILQDANWSVDEINQLADYLDDPRANFREEILVRNSTFTESAEQYSHNLTEESITRSLQFCQDHREALELSQRYEGVPTEILVAILKVETNLGEWRGKESVFNVFWSLSLGDNAPVQRALLTNDPVKAVEMKGRMIKRAKWARGQLRDLLFVARHGGENPVGILGSFAGAFGLPQFIPSSYRSFGQDGNGDGIIDLDAIPDATRSIGYYLKENGWPNRPDRARMRKSILNYNHSIFYADCVLSLADSISIRRNGALIAN